MNDCDDWSGPVDASALARTLFEDPRSFFAVLAPDGTVRTVNDTAMELVELGPKAVEDEPFWELPWWSHSTKLQTKLRDAIDRAADGEHVTFDADHRDASGNRILVDFSVRPIRDDDGSIRAVLAKGNDISEKKRQASELHDHISQQRATATFSQHALEEQSLDDLMNEAVELVADTLDHDYCKVLELRPDEDDFLLRAGVGWREGTVGSETVGTERESQAGFTLLSERPVVVEDLTAETRFSGPELLTSHDVKSGISTIIGTPDEPWGILGVHDTERQSYKTHDVQFVESIAHILSTAIQRRERERRLERSEAMLDTVGDGVYALDADSRFVAVNDAYCAMTGYDREELIGEPASKVTGSDLEEEMSGIQAALEAQTEPITVEVTLPTADGKSIPVEARISRFPVDGGYGRVGVVRDISDRKRRGDKLASLHGMMRSLTDAETPDEIARLMVETTVKTLGFPNAAVAFYDDGTSALEPTVTRWTGEIDDALLGSPGDNVAWWAFIEGETKRLPDLDAELDADATMGSAMVVPLGKYGVFLAAAPGPDGFDTTDASLVNIMCDNVQSALDRADREETLRNQRNILQEKNYELERVDRLNRVIREITKALVQASSRQEMMELVCERLADAGTYRLAWFGDYDRATDEVRPAAWAGVEDGYLQEIVVIADGDDAHGQGPAGRAIRTKEVQVQNDLLGDPPFDPWREAALKRGYRSSASIPVTYRGTLRGVLNLYADTPGTFDEREQTVLAELGETIGYALNALEQRQALVSERSIELDFRIGGSASPVLRFVTEKDAKFEFENAVQQSDGRLHAFFTIRDASPDETLPFVEEVSWIDEVRLVAERDDECLYECTLTDDAFLRKVIDRGAVPTSLTATGEEAHFVIRISQTADVRPFVELFESYYDEVELVARRERDEPVMSRPEFEAELTDRLTDRQAEIVQLAYLKGFFEWPRESTAEEIAESLGVSQPTVSRHIRSAERALFGLLFEDRE